MSRDSWLVHDETMMRAGGQGALHKVVSLQDATVVGALKEIHPEHLNSTERRFRYQQEVNALLALAGAGVPRVLDHNAEQWQDKSVSLFIVMEWIEGPTMTNLQRSTLDDALSSILEILRTVSTCHDLGILHRDLKPDNIIFRNGDRRSPIVVDFGMSWSKPAANTSFNTPTGHELGTRFLRLPEFAPGLDQHDFRSDISLVVGVLFYILTGLAPRVLEDGQGKLPHERHVTSFLCTTRSDPRWPALQSIFRIGFQQRLDARFQSPRALAARIERMNDLPQDFDEEEFRREKQALDELLASHAWRARDEIARVLEAGARAFIAVFSERVSVAGLPYGGAGPNLTDGGQGNEFFFFIVRRGTSSPRTSFGHEMRVIDGWIHARVRIENGEWDDYYSTQSSDVEGLEAAASNKAKVVATMLIRALRAKLSP